MAKVEGLTVNGEIIKDIKDKSFFVFRAPYYKDVPDFNNPTIAKRKLIVPIVLPDGSILDYYPNKTSIKQMIAQYGFDMDKWIGHKFEWEIADQMVKGEMTKVLYIVAKRFNDVLPSEVG